MRTIMEFPPEGYIPLSDHARSIGANVNTANQAARQGRITDAVRVHIPGTPRAVWYVPENCSWKPLPVGKPRKY